MCCKVNPNKNKLDQTFLCRSHRTPTPTEALMMWDSVFEGLKWFRDSLSSHSRVPIHPRMKLCDERLTLNE